ncbi:hypothetical protein AB0L70_04275 [Kribbella sp. NPDC051952]|uniref:hypothetical protein n=1 Tax=Kribbella sp. NPDC051952 TaxID=3154851 RepID=UPI003448640B
MNEQDLRERMQHSVLTEFAPEEIDAAADVARGRRGLRRRRAVGGFAAAASVAAVIALGAQYLPLSSAEPEVTQSTTKPGKTTRQSELDPASPYTARVNATTAELVYAANRQLDKTGKYTAEQRAVPHPTRDGKSDAIGELTVTREWKQAGGTGLLWLSIAQPRYALAKDKWCRLQLSCTERKAPNGKQVVVGSVAAVRNSKGVPYRESGGTTVRYARPDGQVVIAAVLGMNTLERIVDGLPKGVKNPAVTWQQLAAVATDPDLKLR